jgi:mitogen-activated protein kinase 1/3
MSRAAPQSGSRKISFNVSEQYDIQDVVGEGAYGVVWYAISLTCVNVKLD